MSLSIKKGDTVKILAGKDKDKTGKVLHVDSKEQFFTVEGVNLRVRHDRPTRQGQKGQKVTLPRPLARGKMILICPNCSKTTRIGSRVDEKGVKHRVCKKCKSDIK